MSGCTLQAIHSKDSVRISYQTNKQQLQIAQREKGRSTVATTYLKCQHATKTCDKKKKKKKKVWSIHGVGCTTNGKCHQVVPKLDLADKDLKAYYKYVQKLKKTIYKNLKENMMTSNQIIENLNKMTGVIKKNQLGNTGFEKFNIWNDNFSRGTHSKFEKAEENEWTLYQLNRNDFNLKNRRKDEEKQVESQRLVGKHQAYQLMHNDSPKRREEEKGDRKKVSKEIIAKNLPTCPTNDARTMGYPYANKIK